MQGKIDPRGVPCVLLGYSNTSLEYVVRLKHTGKIVRVSTSQFEEAVPEVKSSVTPLDKTTTGMSTHSTNSRENSINKTPKHCAQIKATSENTKFLTKTEVT